MLYSAQRRYGWLGGKDRVAYTHWRRRVVVHAVVVVVVVVVVCNIGGTVHRPSNWKQTQCSARRGKKGPKLLRRASCRRHVVLFGQHWIKHVCLRRGTVAVVITAAAVPCSLAPYDWLHRICLGCIGRPVGTSIGRLCS
jgi:hypothetical protein